MTPKKTCYVTVKSKTPCITQSVEKKALKVLCACRLYFIDYTARFLKFPRLVDQQNVCSFLEQPQFCMFFLSIVSAFRLHKIRFSASDPTSTSHFMITQHTKTSIMTSFCLLHLLGDAQTSTLSLEVDNAVGHGNHKEEARRVERQRSRDESQRYMCRKPRRTADACTTMIHRSLSPVSGPTSTNTERCYSPMSVTDIGFFGSLVKNSNAKNGHRNARKPVRHQSFTVTDAGISALRENNRCGRTEMSSLANILSTLEL